VIIYDLVLIRVFWTDYNFICFFKFTEIFFVFLRKAIPLLYLACSNKKGMMYYIFIQYIYKTITATNKRISLRKFDL